MSSRVPSGTPHALCEEDSQFAKSQFHSEEGHRRLANVSGRTLGGGLGGGAVPGHSLRGDSPGNGLDAGSAGEAELVEHQLHKKRAAVGSMGLPMV
jgi:hypothetical protein